MLYLNFVSEYPSALGRREVILEADTPAEAEQLLTQLCGENASILFIDVLDDQTDYDTQISVGGYGNYRAFSSWPVFHPKQKA